jgi:PAS domain S-box-containing protein
VLASRELGTSPSPGDDLPEHPLALLLVGEPGAARDQLQGALASAGLRVTPVPLWPPSGEAALLPPLPRDADVVVLCSRTGAAGELNNVDDLVLGCARTRAAAPAAGIVCALPLLHSAEGPDARALVQAGADDLVLGVPPAPVLLLRVRQAARLARARLHRQREAQQRRALAEILDLLSTGRERAAAPEGDGVPLLDPRDPRDLGRLFQQVLVILTRALCCEGGALLLRGEEETGLTLIATAADAEPPPLALARRGDTLQELQRALASGQRALIAGVDERALLLGQVLRLAGDSTPQGWLLCVPLREPDRMPDGDGAAFGLLLYGRGAGEGPGAEALELCDLFARVLALGLREKGLSGALREKTRRVSLQRVAEQRRREALSQYREFFAASADGVVVLDGEGRVVYLNRIAEQLTGYAAAGLTGGSLLPMVPAPQRDGLLDAVRQVIRQVMLQPFDLHLVTTSGETLVLSVSAASALSEHGLAVLSFRDVTEQRILEHELRTTKEFLERLIDSTVDGIIAADLQGNILVFNQGAARITGYAPEEVIGKLQVWELYPGDEARRIMAQLRSGEHGGVGRLAQSRRTILGRGGAEVPVLLSAALVYEGGRGGRELATVGVLSDLRERLDIEERLQKVQERLQQSEKQALLAELAGTAAHELNQPLTSVMGYAGLLRRKISADSPELLEFIDIVVREAERMAEIVRKIGRITRYETKAYVGQARILDLDKSSTETPSPGTVLPAHRGRGEEP